MAAMISPQSLAVGETNKNVTEHPTNTSQNQSYAAQLQQKQSASKIELIHVAVVHGEPVIEFSMDEVNEFTREEGLHQAVVVKFSYGKPELHEIRKNLPMQFDIQGPCNIGLLEYRHLLIRFDLFNDFVKFLSRSTGYMKSKGEEFFFRTFPWSLEFNPREETSMAVVWISFPGLPPNFFAKKSLLSIASAVGKVLAVDKATQERTRPSAARVKVILDLIDKHPQKVKIVMKDRVTGKSIVHEQEIVYDNLPSYCTYCKHQGHKEISCRLRMRHFEEKAIEKEATNTPSLDTSITEQLKGDARDYLTSRRAGQQESVTTQGKVDQQVAAAILAPGVSAKNVADHAEEEDTIGKNQLHHDAATFPKMDHGVESAIATGSQSLQFTVQTAGKEPTNNLVGSTKEKDNTSADQKINIDVGFSTVGEDAGETLKHNFENSHKVAESDGRNGRMSIMKAGNVEKKEKKNVGQDRASQIKEPTFAIDVGSIKKKDDKSAGHVDGPLHVKAPIDDNLKKDDRVCLFSTTKIIDGKLEKEDNAAGPLDLLTKHHDANVQQNAHGSSDFTKGSMEKNEEKEVGQFGRLKGKHEAPNNSENVGSSKGKKENTKVLAGQKFNTMVQIQSQLQQISTNTDGDARPQHCFGNSGILKINTDASVSKQNLFTSIQAHSSNAPTLHFSNPNVERIIKDAQHEMMMKETIVQQPLVALNTSVYDVPSNSVESYGDYGGESGQLVISTGNNNAVHEGEHESDREDIDPNEEEWEDEYDEEWEDASEKFSCANLKREQENRLKQRFQFASHRVERIIKDEIQIPFFENTLTGKLKTKWEAPDFIPSKPPCRTCIHFLDTPPKNVDVHIGTSKTGAILMKNATWSEKKNVRQIPMRAAKQKQAAATSSSRSNRSKNKR